MRTKTKVDVMVDLQFGSTGKGLFAGYLAKRHGYDAVINANMPNAGHTFVDKDGTVYMHKVLPNGIVADNVKIAMIGPGSVFSIDRLLEEIDWLNFNHKLDGKKILIHKGATALMSSDIINEMELVGKIGSTGQGSSEAMIRKIRRSGNNRHMHDALKNVKEVEIIGPFQWQVEIRNCSKILLEGAQGFSLGVNQMFYPYCTSRDCTPSRFMTDCCVPLPYLGKVYGVARMHPIRVGGNSGGHYSDQREMSWSDLGLEPETTTVTGRNRRIFTFSQNQIAEAVAECMPDEVFLNFCNYDPNGTLETIIKINNAMDTWGKSGSRVTHTGWGASEFDIREVEPVEVGDVSN